MVIVCRRCAALAGILLLVMILSGCGPLAASAGPDLRIEDAWARPAPQSSNGAVYFTLRNEGNAEDTIVGVSADVATATELHQTTHEDDVMRMMPMESVPVPAGSGVVFEPGSYHVMLIGLTHALQVGDQFDVTLEFEKSPPLTTEVVVREQ